MIKYKKGICYGCKLERWIVHKTLHLCVYCNKKRLAGRDLDRRNRKIEEGLLLDPDKLAIYYQSYWNRNSERFCVECGVQLLRYNRWHIHHLIGKKYWKEYEDDIVFDDRNCVYVCLECHSKAETNVGETINIRKITEDVQKLFRKKNSEI